MNVVSATLLGSPLASLRRSGKDFAKFCDIREGIIPLPSFWQLLKPVLAFLIMSAKVTE